MANPQPIDAHLRVAHEINEQLMVSNFTAIQRRILDLILRLSWGCGKKEAMIPRQRDFEVIGVGEGHVKKELDVLERDHIILRDNDTYSFNKDFDQWRVSRARGYDPVKLTKLVSLNLRHTYQNGKSNLPNREVSTYLSGKFGLTDLVSSPDTNLATPKERTKESTKESTKQNNKEEDIDNSIVKESNLEAPLPIDIILQAYEKNIGKPDGSTAKEIRNCVRSLGPELIYEAITAASDQGNKTWPGVYQMAHVLRNGKGH